MGGRTPGKKRQRYNPSKRISAKSNRGEKKEPRRRVFWQKHEVKVSAGTSFLITKQDVEKKTPNRPSEVVRGREGTE